MKSLFFQKDRPKGGKKSVAAAFKKVKIAMLFSLLAICQQGLSRFAHQDAGALDSDALLDTEYFQTLFTYENIAHWQERFEEAKGAVRLNVGSVDLKRSVMSEDIKISEEKGYFHLGVSQHKTGTPVEKRLEQKIVLSMQYPDIIRLSLLADLDAEKKYSDIGASLRLGSKKLYLRADYWSVDHFYNEKEKEGHGEYQKTPISKKGAAYADFAYLRFKISFEVDDALTWLRPLEGQSYSYQREVIKGRAAIGHYEKLRFKTTLNYEKKTESFLGEDLATLSNSLARSLEHKEKTASLLYGQKEGVEFGARSLLRSVHFYRPEGYLEEAKVPLERPSTLREEKGAYLRGHHGIFSSGRHFMRYGLYADKITIKESPSGLRKEDITSFDTAAMDTPKWEVKFQIGLEVEIKENALFYLGNLFDLDDLAKISQEKVSPNAGTNMQLQITF